jgi:predicted dehydrogenase
VGSRQRRVTGDGYDNFSIDFEFENGIHLHSMCRQINDTPNKVTEIIQGTKGVWYGGGDQYITDLAGNEIWRYDRAATEGADGVPGLFAQNNPYVLEHVNLVSSIRSGAAVNQAEETAISTLAGVMGRDAAYTGGRITWDEESARTHGIVPENPVLENLDMTKYTVPVPGR